MFELTEKLEALIFSLAFVSGKSPNAYLCEILNEYFDSNDKKKLQVKINSLVTYMVEMFKKFFTLNYKTCQRKLKRW